MSYNKSDIHAILVQISPEMRTLFAASCCERLLPNYQAFTILDRWGNFKVLRQGLDSVWGHFLGKELTEKRIETTIRKIEENMPESEDFSSLYSELAADAAEAMIYTLSSIITDDVDVVLNVSNICINSIENYLGFVSDPETEVHGANQELDL